MSDLTLRDCQVPMVQTMTGLARCNVLASPGTGKTTATLMALDVLSLTDSTDTWPVLVVAPLRVAKLVWHQEVADWARFKGVRVAQIVGTPAQRTAALKSNADLYIINYDNLKWLTDTLNGQWPFKTVVCDEATRIKGHRMSLRRHPKTGKLFQRKDGTRNASSLVSQARHTERWINLTGTPTPNGVKDLWGLCWPVDFGASLGASFSAFSERWFRAEFGSSPEQQRIEPLPGAEAEILDRIKPYSVSIDAYDWFDIDRPVELLVEVDLPPKVRDTYNAMHKHSIVELQEAGAATAVNAGSKVMKCRQIAAGYLRDDDGVWHDLHSEKLAALAELRESLNGEPLIVAYHFKRDVEKITQRFKDAVVLPAGAGLQKVHDQWNEGRIPLLLLHGQSASHGLSLQWGGNNMCIYTPDWNAEYYEQVIERIGPTRQAQAGFKRSVFIHRMAVRRTWDEIILKRLDGKIEVSDMVKEALAICK